MEHGATLLDRSPVTGLRDVGGRGRGRRRRRRAPGRRRSSSPPTPGRTSCSLSSSGACRSRSRRSRSPTSPARDPRTSPRTGSPIWIWMDDPCFYGFPTYGEAGPEGRPGRRRARDDAGRAHVRGRPGRLRARSVGFMERHLPGAVGPPIYTKTCLYTLTPDRDFVVDRLPDHPNVLVGARRGARVQVRVGDRPDPGRARPRRGARRRPPRSRTSGSTGPSCSRRSPPRRSWSERRAATARPGDEATPGHLRPRCARCVAAGPDAPVPSSPTGPPLRGGR